MCMRDGDDRREARPPLWRETSSPTSRLLSPAPQATLTKTNVSVNLSRDIISLVRALAYFIFTTIRAAPSVVARYIFVRQQKHTEPALLPQYTESLTSGSDPPFSSSFSTDRIRAAVLSSFISHSSSSPQASPATDRTPLLHSENFTGLLDTPTNNPYPAIPLHLEIEASSPSDSDTIILSTANANIVPTFTIDTPSASSTATTEDSSSSCSTPSSSNSSFVMLRPALKKPSVPNTPRLGLTTIDGDEPSTGRSSPAPKSVRFNTEGNETHFFEYASWEERTKGTGTASTIGKWRKNGGTIVWQDGPDRHRSGLSSPRAESDEEAYSRSLFGQSVIGRLMSSLLLSSRPAALSYTSTVSGGRRYSASLGWGDEMGYRDSMF